MGCAGCCRPPASLPPLPASDPLEPCRHCCCRKAREPASAAGLSCHHPFVFACSHLVDSIYNLPSSNAINSAINQRLHGVTWQGNLEALCAICTRNCAGIAQLSQLSMDCWLRLGMVTHRLGLPLQCCCRQVRLWVGQCERWHAVLQAGRGRSTQLRNETTHIPLRSLRAHPQ